LLFDCVGKKSHTKTIKTQRQHLAEDFWSLTTLRRREISVRLCDTSTLHTQVGISTQNLYWT